MEKEKNRNRKETDNDLILLHIEFHHYLSVNILFTASIFFK